MGSLDLYGRCKARDYTGRKDHMQTIRHPSDVASFFSSPLANITPYSPFLMCILNLCSGNRPYQPKSRILPSYWRQMQGKGAEPQCLPDWQG